MGRRFASGNTHRSTQSERYVGSVVKDEPPSFIKDIFNLLYLLKASNFNYNVKIANNIPLSKYFTILKKTAIFRTIPKTIELTQQYVTSVTSRYFPINYVVINLFRH